MNEFEIIKLEDCDFDFLIIATSYKTPLYLWDEVKKGLGVTKAKILIDLTLINGLKKNRYVQLDYEDGTNVNKSCSLLPSVDERIFNIVCKYFSEHRELLDQPFVPRDIKHRPNHKEEELR